MVKIWCSPTGCPTTKSSYSLCHSSKSWNPVPALSGMTCKDRCDRYSYQGPSLVWDFGIKPAFVSSVFSHEAIIGNGPTIARKILVSDYRTSGEYGYGVGVGRDYRFYDPERGPIKDINEKDETAKNWLDGYIELIEPAVRRIENSPLAECEWFDFLGKASCNTDPVSLASQLRQYILKLFDPNLSERAAISIDNPEITTYAEWFNDLISRRLKLRQVTLIVLNKKPDDKKLTEFQKVSIWRAKVEEFSIQLGSVQNAILGDPGLSDLRSACRKVLNCQCGEEESLKERLLQKFNELGGQVIPKDFIPLAQEFADAKIVTLGEWYCAILMELSRRREGRNPIKEKTDIKFRMNPKTEPHFYSKLVSLWVEHIGPEIYGEDDIAWLVSRETGVHHDQIIDPSGKHLNLEPNKIIDAWKRFGGDVQVVTALIRSVLPNFGVDAQKSAERPSFSKVTPSSLLDEINACDLDNKTPAAYREKITNFRQKFSALLLNLQDQIIQGEIVDINFKDRAEFNQLYVYLNMHIIPAKIMPSVRNNNDDKRITTFGQWYESLLKQVDPNVVFPVITVLEKIIFPFYALLAQLFSENKPEDVKKIISNSQTVQKTTCPFGGDLLKITEKWRDHGGDPNVIWAFVSYAKAVWINNHSKKSIAQKNAAWERYDLRLQSMPNSWENFDWISLQEKE